MKVINSIKELRDCIKLWKREGYEIGLVPTMGYLHEGHKSLINKASVENHRVIVSIFVNPIQFGPSEDLDRYPRDIHRDAELCSAAGADVIFNPSVEEMYDKDFLTYVNVNRLTEGLCGARRPGHFKGVCTVVSKLFNIVNPTRAYFGEKDAQQLAVIKRMVRDLNYDIEIVGCPIIREEDGLAKSSRNVYLSQEERKAATILNGSLQKAKYALQEGIRDADKLRDMISEEINKELLAKIDYVEIVDSVSLTSVQNIKASVLVLVAVYIGKTRLIDNFIY